MNQFFILMLNALLISTASLIDSGFSNHISMDSIVAFTSFSVVTWAVKVLYNAGGTAYQTLVRHESECLFIQTLHAVVLAVIIICFRVPLSFLYQFTEPQRILFQKCLFAYALFLPFWALSNIVYDFLILNGKTKIVVVGNIFYYSAVIGMDAAVVLNGGGCYMLVGATGVCDLLYATVMVWFALEGKGLKPLKVQNIKECYRHSLNFLALNVIAKTGTVLFNVAVSHLGTVQFAIHSIAYQIATTMEETTSICYQFMIMRTHHVADPRKKYRLAKRIMGKTFPTVFVVTYIAGIIIAFAIRGSVGLLPALVFTALYLIQVVPLFCFESFKGFLVSSERSESLRFVGVAGLAGRLIVIPFVLKFGLFASWAAVSFDFMLRAFLLRREIRKIIKEKKIE